MTEEEKAQSLQAIRDIRNIMERSARFLSLSGWSGIWAGCTGLAGAFFAWQKLHNHTLETGYDPHSIYLPELRNEFILIAVLTLIIALAGGYIFTLRKVKKQGVSLWNAASRNLLLHLAIPLAAGGIFVLGMIWHNDWAYIAPSCLIFYGLALINASKYTLSGILYLGLLEIMLGCINLFLLRYGLLFWSVGFGVLHILYGIIMWVKYDKVDDK